MIKKELALSYQPWNIRRAEFKRSHRRTFEEDHPGQANKVINSEMTQKTHVGYKPDTKKQSEKWDFSGEYVPKKGNKGF